MANVGANFRATFEETRSVENASLSPVAGADDDVLRALVRLLSDALAIDGEDEVAGREAAALGHRLGVDLQAEGPTRW